MSKVLTISSVAIIGGGPSGSTLATLLARSGYKVAVFDKARRPPLIIGESLVPAIIPILRRLGVEDEVRSYSEFKPGATFYLRSKEEEATFFFDKADRDASYAYNVPRDKFDETLRRAAERAGVRTIAERADLESSGEDSVRLGPASREAVISLLGEEPQFIVDATGRARLLSKLLKLPAHEGKRRDAALFAHLDHTTCAYQGNVHIDVLEHGWSWRIPLPGRVSVGVVAPESYLSTLGESREEQYDNLLRSNARLKEYASCGTRLTAVMKYNNYQLVSARTFGSNWALVGDAGGFVDPVFSSGLLVSMRGAELLWKAFVRGNRRDFEHYERENFQHIKAWQNVVDNFYNGRLMSLVMSGQEFRETKMGKMLSGHVEKHISRVLTGHGISNSYSNGLLNVLLSYGLRGRDPGALKVH